MDIFFVNVASDVKIFASKHKQNCIPISLSDSASHELIRRNISYKSYYDYLNSSDYITINRISHDLIKSCQNSRSSFKGIDLFDLFVDYYNIFSTVIRKLYLCRKAIQSENPVSVYATNSSDILAHGAETLCRTNNIKCEIFRSPWLGPALSILQEYLQEENLLQAFIHARQLRTSKHLSVSLMLNMINELGSSPLPLKNIFEKVLPLIGRSLNPSQTWPGSSRILKEKYEIIALCPINNSVTVVAPVLQKIEEMGDYNCMCLTMHPNAEDKCKELGIDYANLFSFEGKNTEDSLIDLEQTWAILKNDDSFRSKLCYAEIDIFNSVKNGLGILHTIGFRSAIRILCSLERVLQEISPRLIVVADDTGIGGRSFVRLANKYHIPSINIQHGTIDDVFRYNEAISDKMAVWGKIDYDLLAQFGVEKNKMVITGMPRFDIISAFTPASKTQLFKDLAIDDGKSLFVWTPSPYDGVMAHDSRLINQHLLEAISDVFQHENEIQVVIKVHPLDNINNYKAPSWVKVTQNLDTMKLIYSCDCLLVTNSTTGVEGLVMGKPLLYLNFHKIPETMPYASSGVAIRATNKDELYDAVRSIRDEHVLGTLTQNRKGFIENYLFHIDNKSAERISYIVLQMIS